MSNVDIEQEIPDKLNILYNPDLDYDKQYDSDGYIEDTDKIDDNDEQKDDGSSKHNIIDEINTIITLLPDDMKNIIDNPLSIIETLYDEIKDITNKPINKDEVVIHTDMKDNNNQNNQDKIDNQNKQDTIDKIDNQDIINSQDKSDKQDTLENQDKTDKQDTSDIPDDFFRNDDDPFIIKVKNKDKLTIIKDTYKYDLACVINDYNNKLKNALNNYINNVLISFKNLDVSMYSKVLDTYKLSTDRVSDDYKHLSDLIIRSQTTRQMNMRLYNKIFSIDKTISHIRTCKIGVEQKLRYYTAEYQTESNFNDFINNRFLENSRMMYDEKYKQNFFNLYKYLNSSVILLNECFKLLINEAQAKIILIEKEGNDLW